MPHDGNLQEENCFENRNIRRLECGAVRLWELVASCVLVNESVHWVDYFCCGITVWRNCYWHVRMPTESWFSEPLNQLMESAIGIVLQPEGHMVTQGRGTSGTEKVNTKFEILGIWEWKCESGRHLNSSTWVWARWRIWLRHCATSRKVAGSILYGVIEFFYWHNASGRTMALGSTQPLTEKRTRNFSWG
jgi:hypothetical protein